MRSFVSWRMWTLFVLFTTIFHFGRCFGSGINSCLTNIYDWNRNVIYIKDNNDVRRWNKQKKFYKRQFNTNMLFLIRGGFTDENRIQTQLRPLNHFENKISDRVLYWKWRDNEEKKDINTQYHNHSQIHPYNQTFTLDENEIKMIQNLTQSLDFYLTHGIHNTLHVPYTHTQKRRSFLRKYNKQTNTLKLNCRSFLHSSTESVPTVIVLTGWADSHVKYSTLLHRLYKEGYNVHTYDHRCQGLSESLHKANRQIIDIPNFNDYVDDLGLFYKNIVQPTLSSSSNQKVSIIAHSMGCLVALKSQAKQSESFLDKMILMCPMLQPMTPINVTLTYYISRIITLFGFGTKTATGKKHRGPWLPSKGITHCSIKRSYWEILRKQIPDIVAASPSFRFMREIIRTSNKFRRSIPDALLQIPMFVLTVGEDSYVNTNATIQTIYTIKQKQAKQISKDSSILSKSQSISIQEMHYPNAYHDIISEDSDYMIPNAIDEIVKYLKKSV